MSKIKVNSIEAATGSTITIPSGQTLDISATTLTLPSTVVTTTGTQTLTNKTIGVSQLSGTLPVANGGTGLTTLGSATQVLRVNSGATALEFATAPSGKVLQVVSTTTTSQQTITATTADLTGLSASITPASASNKILVLVNASLSNNGNGDAYINLYRGATQLPSASKVWSLVNAGGTDTQAFTYSILNLGGSYLDSPNTTSSTTYKIEGVSTGGGVLYVNRRGGDTNFTGVSTITLMEIAG